VVLVEAALNDAKICRERFGATGENSSSKNSKNSRNTNTNRVSVLAEPAHPKTIKERLLA